MKLVKEDKITFAEGEKARAGLSQTEAGAHLAATGTCPSR